MQQPCNQAMDAIVEMASPTNSYAVAVGLSEWIHTDMAVVADEGHVADGKLTVRPPRTSRD